MRSFFAMNGRHLVNRGTDLFRRYRWHFVAVLALSTSLAAEEPTIDRILRSPDTMAAVAYQFTPEDNRLLDEIQRGCFEFLWKEVGDPVPIVKDRLTDDTVSSLAGVGFQLSALPIGVERGWVSRDAANSRALAILRGIVPRSDNKKFGIYLHYVDLNTGGMHDHPNRQVQASTIDHALLQAGAMTVSQYFGGEVAELAQKIVDEAHWKVFQKEPDGYISFGWRPEEQTPFDLNGDGDFRPWVWHNASSEEQLVTFLAVGAPNPQYAVPPEIYYKLKRTVKQHDDMLPFAVSWASPAFSFFFSHCWIDYRSFGADDPAQFGIDEPSIDWFENSRRAMLTHRQRCIEKSNEFKTLSENRWGLSPGADINERGEISYIVPSIRPSIEDADNFCGGTVTPYAAGSSIVFAPELAIKALKEFRELKSEDGAPVVWRDLESGGYGLLDSFNLDREEQQGTPDYISIDEGPMILAIENARTGLIWKLFMAHPASKRAVEKLKLVPFE